MRYPTAPDALRRRRLIVAGAAIALLVIAFITYAVLVHRAASTSSATSNKREPAVSITSATEPQAVELPALGPARDPEAFAQMVAEALFAWDTATMIGRTEHIEQLVAVADPTGETTPGLLS